MRRVAALLPFACLAIACAAAPRVGALDHVEAAGWQDGVLEVASARGIGGLALEAVPRTPFRICFRYDASRPYSRLEGLEVAAIGRGGERQDVPVAVTGGCATVAGAPGAATLRIRFVDFYR